MIADPIPRPIVTSRSRPQPGVVVEASGNSQGVDIVVDHHRQPDPLAHEVGQGDSAPPEGGGGHHAAVDDAGDRHPDAEEIVEPAVGVLGDGVGDEVERVGGAGVEVEAGGGTGYPSEVDLGKGQVVGGHLHPQGVATLMGDVQEGCRASTRRRCLPQFGQPSSGQQVPGEFGDGCGRHAEVPGEVGAGKRATGPDEAHDGGREIDGGGSTSHTHLTFFAAELTTSSADVTVSSRPLDEQPIQS